MLNIGISSIRCPITNTFTRNHCNHSNLSSLVYDQFDELARLREIQKSYAKQSEIEGLSKYTYPKVGEIDFLFRKSMLRDYKLGEGIIYDTSTREI
ncbi:MAG TPA: hypothetical protein VGK47_15025 [Nitrososphaeraceae archaeon]